MTLQNPIQRILFPDGPTQSAFPSFAGSSHPKQDGAAEASSLLSRILPYLKGHFREDLSFPWRLSDLHAFDIKKLSHNFNPVESSPSRSNVHTVKADFDSFRFQVSLPLQERDRLANRIRYSCRSPA